MGIKQIIFILLCVILASCGEDRRIEYLEKTAHDRWIYSMMEENYYWNDDLSGTEKLNYFQKAPAFFKSLLSSKDAGYSYVEDKNDMESLKSYGIKFDATTIYNDTAYAIRVLYVDSDSPAKEAGLKRGDWIIKRNERHITRSRIDSLYKGNAITLTLGEYMEELDENGNPIYYFKEKENGKIKLDAAQTTTDNPIHFYDAYSVYGKKIGYLAYNRFVSGVGDGDIRYDDELRSISRFFKSENLSDFILDLRYNTGGDLSSAQLLGSILAPVEALGNPMFHLIYNELSKEKNETLRFSNDVLGNGVNLNLTKLYVITGTTTGSTSDVLINSLKVYFDDLIMVGQTTKGNFTCTHAYSNEAYPQYVFYPVDCLISNAEGEIPTSGFVPTHVVNEAIYVDMHSFGDSNETLLYLTSYLIGNGALPETELKQIKKQ